MQLEPPQTPSARSPRQEDTLAYVGARATATTPAPAPRPRYYANRRNTSQPKPSPTSNRDARRSAPPPSRPDLQGRAMSAPSAPRRGPPLISDTLNSTLLEGDNDKRDPASRSSHTLPHEPPEQSTPLKFRPASSSRGSKDPWPLAIDGRELPDDLTLDEPVDMNVAIVNAADAGQRPFLRQAFDLDANTNTSHKGGLYTFEGKCYAIRMLELSLNDIRFSEDGNLGWPTPRNNVTLPAVQATILIYDVTKPASLAPLPRFLGCLRDASIPVVLVPSRTLHFASIRTRERDLVEEQARLLCDGVDILHVSDAPSDVQQRCISVLLHRHLNGQRGPSEKPAPPSPIKSDNCSSQSSRPERIQAVQSSNAPPQRKRSPTTSSRDRADSKLSVRSHSHLGIRDTVPIEAAVDRRGSRTSPDNEDVSRGAGGVVENTTSRPLTPLPTTQPAATFDSLVIRLLSTPSTKAEVKFAPVFLAVYRMFASPSELLQAIMLHYNHLLRGDDLDLGVRPSIDKDLKVIRDWIHSYPGDFAHPTCQTALQQFLSDVGERQHLSTLIEQIKLSLNGVQVDSDTDWACSDSKLLGSDVQAANLLLVPQRSRTPTPITVSDRGFGLSDKLIYGSQTTLLLPGLAPTYDAYNVEPEPPARQTSDRAVSNDLRSPYHSLTPTPLHPLTKTHWHVLIAQSEESVARELTRISSALFLALQPRDLLRQASHPSMAVDPHRPTSSTPLATLTRHFNHVAQWTCSIILLRDKPKHRCLVLTKLMRVARKVRELNDYNTLAALVAGIQGTSIHRLRATWELVSKDARKDFLKLEVLMANARTNASYRLAWENTRKEKGRCPFLAVHQRDLVAAMAGGRTFLEGEGQATGGAPEYTSSATSSTNPKGSISSAPSRQVNWQKFHVVGSILTTTQASPYNPAFTPNEEIRALVLDTQTIEDEDELYARSCALEPAVGIGGGSTSGFEAGVRGWVGRFGRAA